MSAEVIATLSTTIGLLAAFGGCFGWLIRRMDAGAEGLRVELKREIAEVRSDLRSEIAGVRSDLKSETAGVRSELKHETAGIHTDLTRQITEFREEIVKLQVSMARIEGRLEGWVEASAAAAG